MGYASNTTWIVSCVQWTVLGNGDEKIGNCTSQSYRKERNAKIRYNAILEYFEDAGYSIKPLEKYQIDEKYEGVHGHLKPDHKFLSDGTRIRTKYFVLYIDRNPPS